MRDKIIYTAQRAAVTVKLFGDEAKTEAVQARIPTVGRPKKLGGISRVISGEDHERRWEGIAAKKAGDAGLHTSPGATRAFARAFRPVTSEPEVIT